jgi:ribonucleoside-diphosphate reductase beta chain
LTNVTRDESRHVAFGLRAARDGAAAGYAQVIEQAYLESIPIAAWVLIGPARHNPVPVLRPALLARAAQLQSAIDIAEGRLLKQLHLIGLGKLADGAAEAWRSAVADSVNAYQERWQHPHPIQAALAHA